MCYNQFHIGLLILILLVAVLIIKRDVLSLLLNRYSAFWRGVFAIGFLVASVFVVQGILEPDLPAYYLHEGVLIVLLFLAVLYLATRTPALVEIMKSWGFVGLLVILLLFLCGPSIFNRIVEIGTGGIKLTPPTTEKGMISQRDKEKQFKPELILSDTILKMGERIEQDTAMYRIEAYKITATLCHTLIGCFPMTQRKG